MDSERILTQLRTEGYEIVNSYHDSDVVIVNTCGFIDSAVQESLDTIGEALKENGKVIVTAASARVKMKFAKCTPMCSVLQAHTLTKTYWSTYTNTRQSQPITRLPA